MREKTSHWHPVMLPDDYFHRLLRDQEQVEKSVEKTYYVQDADCDPPSEHETPARAIDNPSGPPRIEQMSKTNARPDLTETEVWCHAPKYPSDKAALALPSFRREGASFVIFIVCLVLCGCPTVMVQNQPRSDVAGIVGAWRSAIGQHDAQSKTGDPRQVGVVLDIQRYVKDLGGWVYKARTETDAHNRARGDIENQSRAAELSPVWIQDQSDPRIAEVGSIVYVRYSERKIEVPVPQHGTPEYYEFGQSLRDTSEWNRIYSHPGLLVSAVDGSYDVTVYEAGTERDYRGLTPAALGRTLQAIGRRDKRGPF